MRHQDLLDARILWDYHNQSDTLRRAQLIVGLGSYDLRIADYCAKLYKERFGPKICFTGASGNWTSGLYQTTEAAAFYARAVDLGIPATSISVEEKAGNIGENILFTREIFPSTNTIIWVTKPQTQRRLKATLAIQAPDIASIVSAPKIDLDTQPTQTHSMHDLICEMVGDIWRMAAYPAMGYMVDQDLPIDVVAAFNRLILAGFTDHLPPEVRNIEDRL